MRLAYKILQKAVYSEIKSLGAPKTEKFGQKLNIFGQTGQNIHFDAQEKLNLRKTGSFSGKSLWLN